MQTFLPYPDFRESALVLDRRRLGKQRLETWQLSRGMFPHHPCSKMWRGYEAALLTYGVVICLEWIGRGYGDDIGWRLNEELKKHGPVIMPPWFGGPIHANHRARLVAKDPRHYSRFFWEEGPTWTNYWPE